MGENRKKSKWNVAGKGKAARQDCAASNEIYKT